MNYLAVKWALLKAKLLGSLQSAVMWVNTLVALAVPFLDYAQQQLPLLYGTLPQNLYAWAFGATVVLNMVLRFRTSNALEDKSLAK